MYLAERTEETTMDGIRFVRGGPSHADGVEVLFSVEDQAEAVDKGKEILDALPDDEDVPDFVALGMPALAGTVLEDVGEALDEHLDEHEEDNERGE